MTSAKLWFCVKFSLASFMIALPLCAAVYVAERFKFSKAANAMNKWAFFYYYRNFYTDCVRYGVLDRNEALSVERAYVGALVGGTLKRK